MASNRTIGVDCQMPWHLSADLKKFRQITTGHAILMGRRTHQAIGRPLPERRNLVISRNPDYHAAGCEVFHDIQSALDSCGESEEVFVIGGGVCYETMLPQADFIYLTEIDKAFKGDTYFPEFDTREWQEIERIEIDNDETVDFSYRFLKLQRINSNEKD